jgi:phenylalanyl-tRNA synthetase beta chain
VAKPDPEKLKRNISIMLASNGFYEIMNNSLTKESYARDMDSFDENRNVKILNPLSSDLNVLRQSLLFGGLKSIENNHNHKIFDIKFFEFGNTYFYDADKKQEGVSLSPYTEIYNLDLFITGKDKEELWSNKPQNVDFYELKKYVLGVLHKLNIDVEKLEMTEGNVKHYEYSLVYTLNGMELCTLGKINQKTLKLFDLKREVYHATMNWDNLLKANKEAKAVRYEPLPKFPAVRRDLALILDKNVTFEQIKNVALTAENKILKSVGLFDIYTGDKIPEGKKQYALSFVLLDTQKTLTDKVIEKTMAKIQSAIEQQLKATLR